ncbi:MAG: co-chaperone YbbN [Microbacteriaceae bacterium]
MTALPPSAANLRGAVDLSSLVRPPAAARKPVEAPSLVVDGTDANFTGILDLSNTVPVVVELYAIEPSAALNRLVIERGGSLVLARVEATANRQLVQAFQADRLPTVAAVIAGRPIALYSGELPDADVRQVFDQLLALAAQNGVTGKVDVPLESSAGAEGAAEPAQEPLPPLHQEAYDAIAAGDYPRAIKAYQTAIAQNPRDDLAAAGLAQVQLLDRLRQRPADGTSAARLGDGVDAQLAAADLELSDGSIEAAFERLLTLFPTLDSAGKDRVRSRLLEFFQIVGSEDQRVVASRRRLTSLLY